MRRHLDAACRGMASVALLGSGLMACNAIAGLDDLDFSTDGAGASTDTGAAGGAATGAGGPGGNGTGGATGGGGNGAGGGGGGPPAVPGELLCSVVFPDGQVRGLAADPQGGFVMSGWQDGGIDLGGGPLPGGGFIARFDASCEHIFSIGIDGSVDSLVVADDGNIYVAGGFSGTATFGNDTVSSDGGSPDLFISRLDEGGTFQWTRAFGGPGDEWSAQIDVDESGVYVGSLFEDTFMVGATQVTSMGIGDVLVTKLSLGGAVQWTTAFGGPSSERIRGVKVDSTGAIVVAGRYRISMTVAGIVYPGIQGRDPYVIKLTPAGDPTWVQVYGSQSGSGGPNGNDYVCGLALRSDDSIVVTGPFTGIIDFGAGSHTADGESDIFLLELTSGGSTVASRQLGGPGDYDRPCGLAIAADDAIVVGGTVDRQADFGGGPIGDPAAVSMYALYLNSNGALSWAVAFGAGTQPELRVVRAAVDASGNMLMGGRFENAVDFGKGPVGQAGENGFVVKLAK